MSNLKKEDGVMNEIPKQEGSEKEHAGLSTSKLSENKQPYSITAMFQEGKWKISGYQALEDCAFCILELENEKKAKVFAIGIGTDVICDKPFKNTEEAKEYMKVPQWDMIWNLCNMMFDKKMETLKTNEK